MAHATDVPSSDVLRQSGQREAAALVALLEPAEAGQSVHGARRRIKQLRSLLRLLRQPMGEAGYGEAGIALRQAAQALAGQRRAEALVGAAERLEQSRGSETGFWVGLAQAHRAAHAAEADPARALGTAREAVGQASHLLSQPLASGGSEDAVWSAFLAAYRKARKLLGAGLKDGEPETLHEARKFVIHHLHHLRLLSLQDHRQRELEGLRETLGDLNDLDELQQLADGVAVPSAEARRIRKARERLLRQARKAAGKLFRHRPAALAKRLGHAADARSP